MSTAEGAAEGAADAAASAQVFAALGDPTRLGLLRRLSAGPALSIASLSTDTALTRQAVTKHLHVLEQAGLVRSTRIGRESRYAYQPDTLDQARAWLDAVSRQWDEALGRLRLLVETE